MNWSCICPVNPAPLIAWLAGASFPAPSTPTKPQRIQDADVPLALCEPIMNAVLKHAVARRKVGLFACTDGSSKADVATTELAGRIVAASPMLSRVLPGQIHPMHVDIQRSDWLTRVHVPLTTNPGCWMAWEGQCSACDCAYPHCKSCMGTGGERVHFEVGNAYTFNTLARHAFGNEGETERVHLIFEVLRG